MKTKSRLDQFLASAALVIIVVAPTQWSFRLRLGGDEGTFVTLVDLLVGLTFLLWVAKVLFVKSDRLVRLPTPSCFALVAAACLSMLAGGLKGEAVKETVQLIEYFLIAYVVLANCITDREVLRRAAGAFTLVASVVVIVALCQYHPTESFFGVRGTFGNRNVLSVYLALALPVVFAIALYRGGCLMRLSLVATVFVGVAMSLSGGPLLGLLLGLGVISALRGRVLLGGMVVLALAGGWLGAKALRPQHIDAVIASVTPFVDNNYLLDNRGLMRRAEELIYGRNDVLDRFIGEVEGFSSAPEPLIEAAKKLKAIKTADKRRKAQAALGKAVDNDESIEKSTRKYWGTELRVAQDCERYNDARRLLTFIRDDLKERKISLSGKEQQDINDLYSLCKKQTRSVVWEHHDFAEPRAARRYKGWSAAITAFRNALIKKPGLAFFGRGAGSYNRAIIREIEWYPTARLHYDTDEPEVFNIGSDEADTFGQFFVTLSELGIVGLVCLLWVWLSALGKAARVWRITRDAFHRALALGLIGSLAAFPLCALFSGIIVRGVAVPFIFLIVCADLLRRFETEIIVE